MKITVLEIIGDSTLAGAPRHLLSVVENLDLEKFSISIICPPGPLAGEIKKLKRRIDLEIIPMRSRFDTVAIRKIRKEIKRTKPNVIHVHGTRAGILGRMAAVGFNLPVIYTEHLWTKHFRLQNRVLNWLHLASYWFLDMFTTLNIAVSEAVKEFMVENEISRSEKIKVIYNGIEQTSSRADIFKDKENLKIATIGTLNYQKGIQYLIEAMPKIIVEYPDVKLEIIGDGPYRLELERLVKKLKLGKAIKFNGFMPDVENYLTEFDLYVQPSISESFGLAIVQAMSVGLPIVATNAGGIPEVVTSEKSGLLVEPANPKALADAILALLRDPVRAKQMGDTAQREAKLKFQLDDMIAQMEEVYIKMAKHGAIVPIKLPAEKIL